MHHPTTCSYWLSISHLLARAVHIKHKAVSNNKDANCLTLQSGPVPHAISGLPCIHMHCSFCKYNFSWSCCRLWQTVYGWRWCVWTAWAGSRCHLSRQPCTSQGLVDIIQGSFCFLLEDQCLFPDLRAYGSKAVIVTKKICHLHTKSPGHLFAVKCSIAQLMRCALPLGLACHCFCVLSCAMVGGAQVVGAACGMHHTLVLAHAALSPGPSPSTSIPVVFACGANRRGQAGATAQLQNGWDSSRATCMIDLQIISDTSPALQSSTPSKAWEPYPVGGMRPGTLISQVCACKSLPSV